MIKPTNNKLVSSLSKLSQAASSRKDSISGTVLKLHPDECYEMENPRTVFDDALLNSIVEDFRDPNKGQQEAIYVYPADENGKYRVQIGATRLHAGRIVVKENPDFRLKAIIDTAIVSKDESEQYFERGMSNIKRNNMTLRDRANFIADYLEKAKKEGKKITQADVAERLGLKNSSAVSRLLKLRFMSAEVESLYNTGVTTDIDTLASLVDIQQENPALFSELIALPEIERSTVRQAKKNGTLKIVDPEEAESTAFKENEKLAHAQNSQTGSTDDEVVTIAYVDYIFKTGSVNLLIKQTSEGFLASLETIFEHGITYEKSFAESPLFASEDEAANFAKSLIEAWAESVISDKDAVSIEEYQDAKSFLQWLKTSTGKAEKPAGQQRAKKVSLNATIWGEVNGEKCELLVNVSQEVIGADMKDKVTSGFVLVSVDGVVKLVNEKDFVFKSAEYKE
ncbi:hypothetical protein OA801_24870 [Citrobacter portucalensis]|uniref:ParB/RepB/Spo0J family partition protein n=1 Tax=Citrobacter freundii TaxID=546 RepID=UPI001BCF85F2|nr:MULTISPECIES: KorB domain-containing protein [Citrobacter freundii complex]MDN4196403.1 hypothetical protein [Citrobacter freundii]MDN4226823.1 hypothetical protein [Citrobacter freundii]MDN4361464.1 hypothetical protein [Citrobacter portucalensis]MDN4366445.1 hypothetical protein [Citrobacter portucalensis]MDN4381946.1 hypothetical protein [Citrobacter portucalensis]